jgi:hypothetical protein
MCSISLSDECDDTAYSPDHTFTTLFWSGRQYAPLLLSSPEVLENVWSYAAYNDYDVRDVIQLCSIKAADLDDALRAEQAKENIKGHSNISPPNLVMPHDKETSSIRTNKTFYQYRTRTDPGRFEDKIYCAHIRKDLQHVVQIFRCKLYHDGTLMCTYFDSGAGIYRTGCMFPSIKCSDVFGWGCADSEEIPARDFDWIMKMLEETNFSHHATNAICSWLRNCKDPLERSNTPEFKRFLEQICAEHGKPWELIDRSSAAC